MELFIFWSVLEVEFESNEILGCIRCDKMLENNFLQLTLVVHLS
jgi:hypothetical protein